MDKNTETKPRYYSTATVCEMLDVSRSWVWEQVNAGKFPKPVKFGRLARYPVLWSNTFRHNIKPESQAIKSPVSKTGRNESCKNLIPI